MGSNMQRQALELLNSEIAIVGTGIEKVIAKTCIFNRNSKNNGIIKYINKNKILTHENINLKKFSNEISETKFRKEKNKKIKILYKNYKKKIYQISSQEKNLILIKDYKKHYLQKNIWINKGNSLSQGKSSKKDNISIGRNILIAYMVWKGYNFEDAIIINEKLVYKDTLTSFHLKKYKTFIIANNFGNVKLTLEILHLKQLF